MDSNMVNIEFTLLEGNDKISTYIILDVSQIVIAIISALCTSKICFSSEKKNEQLKFQVDYDQC